ncbi:MAG: S9 family peptidase [Acidobacteria bacterium]|nr:S9 family peptidase [Acidobacteriota bacterium]
MTQRTFVVLLATALGALAQWTPDISMQVVGVGGAVPSPDGTWVAYTQTRQVMEKEKSETLTQVWLARADGGKRSQLTHGEKSSSNPSFSEDGKLLYFTSSRSGKNQVWRIPLDGGEAEPVTNLKDGVASYQLSPNGKHVAFTAVEIPAGRETARKEKRDFRIVNASPDNALLYIIPAEPDSSGKRTHKKLSDPGRHVVAITWSPDSRSIAFAHQARPEADYWPSMDISEADIESGAVKPIADTAASESNPHYSPDGANIAYQRSGAPARWPLQERIVLQPRSGGAPRELPATFDESPQIEGWDGAGRRILFSESRGTRRVLYWMPIDGPPATAYAPADATIAAAQLNRKGTHVAFLRGNSNQPAEVFLVSASMQSPRQMSKANESLPNLPLPRTEVIRWKSKDGTPIEGLLTYPTQYTKGQKYPFLLNIHGGPAGVFTENFIGGPGVYPLAALAAKGYAILRPNPRGSSGYGAKFRFANENDWGGGDYDDLMAGVDHVIAIGIADPDHMGVMGWSYGGFMTSWVIGHTNRFKAAVVGAAVTNLWSFTGTADIPGFLPDYFRGEPWDVFEHYRRHSPMTYAGKIQTPSLILHGEADLRVPISQGYELHNALQRRGVTTQMVTYPRMPHGPNEPKFMLDIMNRHIDWMEKYVR